MKCLCVCSGRLFGEQRVFILRLKKDVLTNPTYFSPGIDTRERSEMPEVKPRFFG